MLIKSGELNSVLMLYNTDIDSLLNIKLNHILWCHNIYIDIFVQHAHPPHQPVCCGIKDLQYSKSMDNTYRGSCISIAYSVSKQMSQRLYF